MDVFDFKKRLENLNGKINEKLDNHDFRLFKIISQTKENFITIEDLIEIYTNKLADSFFDSLESWGGSDWVNELPSLRPFLDDYNGIILDWDCSLDFEDSWREDNTIRDSIYFNKVCNIILSCCLNDISYSFNSIKCANGDFYEIDEIFFIHEKCWMEKVRDKETFEKWIKELNYDNLAISRDIDKIGTYDFTISFIGNDEEMNTIPRLADIKFIENTGYDWIPTYKKMQVNIKDGEISISYNKNKIGEDYFNEIVDSFRRIKLEIDEYTLIDADLLSKAKYLMENHIKCHNPWYEGYQIKDIIDDYEQIINMAIEKDNQTWDGTVGNVVMMNVSEESLNKYYRAVREIGVVLIRLEK